MKKTTYKVTSSIKYMEMEILKVSGLSLTAFQRKAIDAFLKGEQKVDDVFKIKRRNEPNYIQKPIAEQIYLDDERAEKLMAIASRENCGITIVLLQAAYNYCLACATMLSQDVINNIITNNYPTNY